MENSPNILAISQQAFLDEALAVRPLLARLENIPALESRIMAEASALTEKIRATPHRGVEALMNAYGLASDEGVALMCLAEALLRIPDTKTADAMIEDTLVGQQWERYTSGDSWMVSLSGWGLLAGGKVAQLGQEEGKGIAHVLKNLVARVGEPIVREALKKAMRAIGDAFVIGQTMEEALANAKSYQKRGYRFSFDILGEGARSDAQAQAYVQAYREGIALIGAAIPKNTPLFDAPGISIKLSALHARYQLVQQERVMAELLPRLVEIVSLAKQNNIAVSIDAEESTRLDIEMLVFERLMAAPEVAGWNGVGFVVQAYQKRAFTILDWLAGLAQKHSRKIPVRLVKGAYWDFEIKAAQMQGLPSYPVFTRKEHTDVSYLACAEKLLSGKGLFFPQFATHNARTLVSARLMAEKAGWKKGEFELQRLFGMGEALHDLTVSEIPSRIYAPVGAHKDLLAYLIRRLLENGANSSFVHQLMDKGKSVGEILPDPIARTRKNSGLFNPPLPLPVDIYGTRKNSTGMDFGNLAQLSELQQAVAAPASRAPDDIDKTSLDKLLAAAQKAFPAWSATHVEQRATALEKAADLIEEKRDELVSLCAFEAKKTLPDAIAEVREAADYCRYYAAQARALFAPHPLTGPAGESNVLSLHPRGIFACVSPWNFPLAIFTGQVTAALAAGNCVIAKPAEQTPKTAQRAAALLHEAGIPQSVLQLAPGKGETIGQALVSDPRISGVAFTGGTDTAVAINKTLAARGAPIIPLIAETGGQNCMVVDSSALLEQVVDDVMLSAFGSAGQRCSSLRVLYVQDEIADELLGLLKGAMAELTVGNPETATTDIGPVIDKAAQDALLTHIEVLRHSSKFVAAAKLPSLKGHFVAPHIFEIKSIAQIRRENFGPVLHVIRFHAGELSHVVDEVSSTGYGLTFGIHSRIDGHVRQLAAGVRAGNIYVNRSMIGATVGVQPFGGENLSGTGPKAGGPHYLLRFCTERAIAVNTAAIGGNVALLSK